MELVKRAGLPEHLSTIWDELEPTVYDRIGPVGLEALCGQVYLLREAEERVKREGMVVQDVKGNPTPHPGLAIIKQAQAEIRNWVKEYGRRT